MLKLDTGSEEKKQQSAATQPRPLGGTKEEVSMNKVIGGFQIFAGFTAAIWWMVYPFRFLAFRFDHLLFLIPSCWLFYFGTRILVNKISRTEVIFTWIITLCFLAWFSYLFFLNLKLSGLYFVWYILVSVPAMLVMLSAPFTTIPLIRQQNMAPRGQAGAA